MVAAICFKIDEKNKAKIYLVGSYNYIEWNIEHQTDLGRDFSVCNYKSAAPVKRAFSIEKGIDGKSILRLIETKRYILKIEAEDKDEIEIPRFQNEENRFLKFDKDRDSVSFQFINYLGRSKIVFPCGDDTKILQFEVIPDKMNYEEDYIRLTEALAQVCSGLLLEYSGVTSNVYKQIEENQNTLFEQFVFLRQFCYSQNLFALFESIKRNPDRLLVQEDEFKPLGCGKPSKKYYTNPFSYSKRWGVVKDSKSGNGMFMPQMVAVTKKQDSVDTPANRFIKFAFEKFNVVCIELIETLNSEALVKQSECCNEAKVIHSMLEKILRDSFFDEVGPLDIMPQNNQVLQKREGYSQIFSAYAMIDLALQLDWRGRDNVYEGESKNVALLYEYWLFFELYKIIRSIEGCELVTIKEDPFLLIDDEITISLEQGKKSCQAFEIKRYKMKINLYYNRTFSKTEFHTTRYEGSYSRPFRPDYTIAIYPNIYTKGRYNGEEEAIKNGSVSYIHFDAKYRITDLTTLIGKSVDSLDEEEVIDEKIGSVVNTYKRGDLLKMHTYNDAIRRTIGSYVLYPGTEYSSKKNCTSFRLYDEILPGVGAFAIRPSIDAAGENELKDFITALIKAKEADHSRLNRMKYYTEMVLREPSLSPVHKQDNEFCEQNDKLGEMCVLGYIRADSSDDYYFHLKENKLLEKDGEFLFYFYAIKGTNVYSHHKDVFKATDFRFYKNPIRKTNSYELEPVFCKILSNELVSKSELVERLKCQGYNTDEAKHHADFYYVLRVKVVDENYPCEERKISDINAQNGNDTFSPHSPKVVCY